MKTETHAAPLRFKLVPTVDGGTRVIRADTPRDCGAFPLRAVAPVKERRAPESLLRDIAEAMAAAEIFN